MPEDRKDPKRVEAWRTGKLDARDARLRTLARSQGLSVGFTAVDRVVIRRTVFSGSADDALVFLEGGTK